MRDDGHFTFEAVVGLAIVATIMLSVQTVELGSIGRRQRAQEAFDEAIALDHLVSCIPKATAASRSSETPTVAKAACPPPSSIGTVSENVLLRIHAVPMGKKDSKSVLQVLTLEFAE
ncbi:MAG: hypothetical protein O9322_05605 [Beijerinckiaceae bacterium]|nr:hypothetical protein [Beijerinckiaceae bacterium]MCZ8298997.1 hypothetical protein [Beijerinckiaceae bacterium]